MSERKYYQYSPGTEERGGVLFTSRYTKKDGVGGRPWEIRTLRVRMGVRKDNSKVSAYAFAPIGTTLHAGTPLGDFYKTLVSLQFDSLDECAQYLDLLEMT